MLIEIYQPGRLGDIIYVMAIAQRLQANGHKVIFPIHEKYKNIAPHFPDINFVSSEEKIQKPRFILPLWYGKQIDKNPDNLMTNKYKMYNLNLSGNGILDPCNDWRKVKFKRFQEKEDKLFKEKVKTKRYILRNERSNSGKIEIPIKTDLEIVDMDMSGSLIDWSKIIENAEEIHTVHTSLIYLVDLLKTTTKLFIYKRNAENVKVSHLLQKRWKEI